MAEVRTVEDVHDLVHGLTLLGTGGGGRPEQGLESLLPHVQAGGAVSWADPNAIPDDAWVCSTFGMGSIAPTKSLSTEERRALGYPAEWTVARPMVRAVRELEAYTGKKVAAIVPFELGAGNTATPMDAAVHVGAAIVDGDFAGRAIPELCQTSAAIAGMSFAPGAIVDPWGNVLLVKQTASELLTERIGKLVSIATKLPDMKASCAHAGFLMSGKDLKRVAVPGGITRALAVGRAIRAAKARGADPVAAAAEALGGWVLFRGRVAKKEWESRDGYMYGTTTVEGEGADARHTLRVWFKNENHVTWRDGAPWVLSPDLIMTIGADGTPYTNTLLPEGARIGVVGAVADPRLRTPAALDLLGPCHYGYDLAYTPIEELVRRSAVGGGGGT
ncbi:MAG: DUF917 domain-containing protein [Candidatus Rokuibacteriota bacterium]|nr:MAG: DUF917 domain-containing protein [Candidatus Rokubacteria bacterium]